MVLQDALVHVDPMKHTRTWSENHRQRTFASTNCTSVFFIAYYLMQRGYSPHQLNLGQGAALAALGLAVPSPGASGLPVSVIKVKNPA